MYYPPRGWFCMYGCAIGDGTFVAAPRNGMVIIQIDHQQAHACASTYYLVPENITALITVPYLDLPGQEYQPTARFHCLLSEQLHCFTLAAASASSMDYWRTCSKQGVPINHCKYCRFPSWYSPKSGSNNRFHFVHLDWKAAGAAGHNLRDYVGSTVDETDKCWLSDENKSVCREWGLHK